MSASKPVPSRVKQTASIPLTPSRYAGYDGSAYEHVRILGKGAFGLVTLNRCTSTGELRAMKTVDRFRLTTPGLRKSVVREVNLLQSVVPPHRGIIPLVEVIETCRSIHMVFEYASCGTLHDYCAANGALGEAACCLLTKQLCEAVSHLHRLHVCHRDLKLDNLVLDHGPFGEDGGQVMDAHAPPLRVRVIDFGLSAIWPADGTKLRRVAGSLCYMAPEMVQRQPYEGAKLDAWSLGVCVAAMLRGTLPFTAESDEALKALVVAGKYSLGGTVLSERGAAFVARLLISDPMARSDVTTALKHPWMTDPGDGDGDGDALAADSDSKPS